MCLSYRDNLPEYIYFWGGGRGILDINLERFFGKQNGKITKTKRPD